MTVTWSHRASTSLSLWVIKITVLPCARNWRNTVNNCCVSCGVKTAVGSSSIRMRAPRNKAFKISKRWRSPTAKSATRASSATSRPVDCIKASSCWRTGALALGRCQCGSAPNITFSSALSVSTSMKCWCTMPMPQAIASWALRICTGLPKTAMRPLSAGCMPYNTDIRVLLPAPFSPIRPCKEPCATVKFTSTLASTSPKRLWIPAICKAGSVVTPATSAGASDLIACKRCRP